MNLVIFGVTFNQNKKVIYALPQLYGIGQASAQLICQQLGIAPQQAIKDLTDNQQYALAKKIKDDFIVEESGVILLVDAMSMQYLSGSVIGYKTSLMGEQFEIKNPNATSKCGCGSSFAA